MKTFLIQWAYYLALLVIFRLVWDAPWRGAVGFAWVIAKVDPLVDD